jgi:hypothetical protein
MDVIWAAGFLTEEVWTLGGLVTVYILFSVFGQSPRVDRSRHATTARRLDGATSQELLHGGRGFEPPLLQPGAGSGHQLRSLGQGFENRDFGCHLDHDSIKKDA